MSDNNYRYQGNIDMSIIYANPNEYIVQECLPACEKLWTNNIFTVSCSNRDEKKDENGIIKKYIMLSPNLSSENVEIFEKQSKEKPKSYRKQRILDTVYYIIIIESEDNDLDLDSKEFLELVSCFKMQDCLEGFVSLEDYYRFNLADLLSVSKEISVSEAELENKVRMHLKAFDKSDLLDLRKKVVFKNEFYKNAHLKYLKYIGKIENTQPRTTNRRR